MIAPPTFAAKKIAVRFLNALLVALLISQLVLPLHVTPALAAPAQQSAPPETIFPADGLEPPLVDLPPDVAPQPPPADALFLQPVTPTLVANLDLHIDQLVLTPGLTATLTLLVVRAEELGEGVATLTLDLPPGLVTSDGQSGLLQWSVLPSASLTQAVPILVDPVSAGGMSGVLTIKAQLSAPGYLPLTDDELLGIAPTLPATNAVQSERGTVLHDPASGVTLLVPAGAAPVGANFHYTPLFRADQPTPTAEPTLTPEPTATPQPTATTPITPTVAPTDLPTIAASATAVLTATLTPEPTATSTTLSTSTPPATPEPTSPLTESDSITEIHPISDNGITTYQQWEFDAALGETPITHFDQPLLLLIDAAWLAAAGLDPGSLGFWTLADGATEWQLEALEYDDVRELWVAQVTHFSGGKIGDGLDSRGEILPSLKAFSSDRFTGAATVHYPIEVPGGLGGMAPELALSYSSNNVDDVLLEAGDDRFEVQASSIGYGWNLSGISYIDRSLRGDKGFYSLVLNGRRSTINGGRTNPVLNEDYFTKITSIQSSTAGQFDGWVVTGTDGTVYTFGDNRLAEVWSSSVHGKSPVSMYLAPDKQHDFDRWYLKEVKDRLGNVMLFKYETEKGDIVKYDEGVKCGNWPAADNQAWYTRATVPSEILWSGNPAAGVSEKLRVRFVYSNYVIEANQTKRPDVGEWDEKPCLQRKFFSKRLRSIFVEVLRKDSTTIWDILRKYELSQSNYSAANGDSDPKEQHLLLDKIEHFGKSGTGSALNAYTFVYTGTLKSGWPDGTITGRTTNNIRMVSANNGWNGAVLYTYDRQILVSCSFVCTGMNTDQKSRYPVMTETVKDGLGNRFRNAYAYNNPLLRADYKKDDNNNWVRQAREFVGYETTTVKRYEIVPATATPNQEIRYEEHIFHQASPQTAADTPRDPRNGRLKELRIWSRPGAACRTYTPPYASAPGTPDTQGRCLLQETEHTWEALIRNGNPAYWQAWNNTNAADPLWVRLANTKTWIDGAGRETTYAYQEFRQNGDQHGNVTEVQEYWLGALQRKTITEYLPNTTLNIVNKPARVRVYDATGTCRSELRAVYDDLEESFDSQPIAGLVVKTQQALTTCAEINTIAPNDVNWFETRMAYDVYGNQIVLHRVGGGSATDDWTSTDYDSFYKLFPIKQYKGQNSSFAETAAYYGVNGNGSNGGYGTNSAATTNSKAFWGAMAEYCGLNQVCTRQSYDAFGRRLRRWEGVGTSDAWGSDSASQVLWSYREPDSSAATFIVTEARSPRCYGNFTRKHYNGLGQLVQVQSPQQNWARTWDGCTASNTNGDEVDVDYTYDALGQPMRVSVPRGYLFRPLQPPCE